MTDAELSAIEARANAATEGPWVNHISGDASVILAGPPKYKATDPMPKAVAAVHWGSCDTTKRMAPDDRANSDFIASARTDVPALVAEVRRLRAKLDDQAVEAMGEDA